MPTQRECLAQKNYPRKPPSAAARSDRAAGAVAEMGLGAGLAAGAAGTTALNVVTYLDMVVRGRPASEMPAKAADDLVGRFGVGLGAGDAAESRRQGLGALLGFAAGLGFGGLYGVLAGDRHVPGPLAALALGAIAMAGADAPMVALGLTDPRQWGSAGWASDVVPHLAYGAAAAAVYRGLLR